MKSNSETPFIKMTKEFADDSNLMSAVINAGYSLTNKREDSQSPDVLIFDISGGDMPADAEGEWTLMFFSEDQKLIKINAVPITSLRSNFTKNK